MRPNKVASILLAACFPLLASCGGGGNGHPGDAGDDDGTDAVEADGDGIEADSPDAAEDGDADGSDSSDCPDGYAFNPYGTTPGCVACTRACGLEGETGEVWPTTAVSGECVCITIDGYYFSLSGAGVSHRCDKDQDGWVTRSAKANIESADDAISANARCDLRVVDSFVLLAEGDAAGDGCTILLADTDLGVSEIALYEADNRDDQVLLDEDVYAPTVGTRKLRAEEVNSLTKACVSLNGDYNSSGTADVNEWDRIGEPLYAFSYYLELHRGWYEDGVYFIQEKSRLADAPPGWGIPIVYNDDAFWRECVRQTDTAYDPMGPNTIGLDFARYDDLAGPNAGMFHHSQYKCVHLVETNTDPAAYPQRLPMEELDAVPRRYVLNTCEAGDTSAEPVTGTGTINPWDAILTCEIDTTPSIDDVGFVAVKYLAYDESSGSYQRGCINGCLGVDPPDCPAVASCAADVNDYGRPECVCPNHWTGVDCDVCPNHWDPDPVDPSDPTDLGCDVCLNQYDPYSDCTTCSAFYDLATDCTTCMTNWDPAYGCTSCLGNYDVATDCTDCLYHYDLITGCTVCELNYNPADLCSTCLGNWDPADNCASCIMAFLEPLNCQQTSNLLVNGDAEAGSLSSWTSISPYTPMTVGPSACSLEPWCGTTTIAPRTGSHDFLCCEDAGQSCRMSQTLVTFGTPYMTGINAGRYSIRIDAWMFGYLGEAGFTVAFQNEWGTPIGSTSPLQSTDANSWTLLTYTAPIPAGTGRIVVEIASAYPEFGWCTAVAFDDVAMYIFES